MSLMLVVIWLGFCNRWYPVVRHLHRFFVAIARTVVNHDDGGGTAPDPLVWSAGSLPKRHRVLHAVRDFAFLPGPVGIWDGDWVSFGVSGITVEDVRVWPYSVSLLVKVSAFLGTLHWPAGAVEFGVGSVSFVELLILYEQWAGERLCLESAIPRHRRVGRPISVSAVPFGPGIDIWRSCRFLGAIFRALRMLPGGLGRFLPGGIGANHGRLRHIGWEKCCHGLTSRPRETSSVWFLDELLILFGYSAASGADLLAGTLPLRYSLRVLLVGSLLGACLRMAVLPVFLPLENWFGVVPVLCLLRWVVLVFAWLVVLVGASKESDYTEKHQHTLLDRVFLWSRFVPGFGRDSGIHWVQILVFLVLSFLRVHQEAEGHDPGFARVGIG